MAIEITAAGYQSLRDYVQGLAPAAWTHVEIRDSLGAAWERLAVSDPRLAWVHAPSAQTLELEVTLTGDDAEMTLPETFGGAAFFNAAIGGSALAEGTFTDVTLEAVADQIVVSLKIQLPEVVV